MKSSEYLKTDVLVIGSGIAGGIAALELARKGISVTLVTKEKDPKESNTNYAQGGIIYQGEDDYPELLAADINKAGSFLSNPRAVAILSQEGPRFVKEILIDRLNVKFDREKDSLVLALEGGHSIPRIIHWADATGRAIQTKLQEALKTQPNIDLLTSITAVDLLTPAHNSLDRLSVYEPLSCVGAYIFDQKRRKVNVLLAKKTILATGGLGQIYLFTTNPKGARGDGVAMAQRAGARITNLEYIQFHPTAFYHPQAPRLLITEAVRGDGARLVNKNGELFMEKYDPKSKDLAPRDIVSRSIYNEMLLDESPNVYLDLSSYISTERILKHFPNIFKECSKYGVDITKDLVPVVPAAHYSCGGVWVDEWGQTSIDGLYAVGEVSCTGLHGANRLASTSLLEGLVWGAKAAENIGTTIGDTACYEVNKILPWQYFGNQIPDPALISQDMDSIKRIMWNYVGLVRTTPRLERAMRELKHLEAEIHQFYQTAVLNDDLLGLRNAIQTASLVTSSAWENKKSVGCHFRV